MNHTEELNNIKMWLRLGAITYDDAKERAKPHIDALNEKSAEIAKKYKMKPRKVSFSAFMR